MARPRFKPTAEQRRIVETMSGYGVPEDQIAVTVGIDAKTLRKYFRHELDTGAAKANAAVTQTLYRMATSGKCPAATIFWTKARAGWKETNVLNHSGPEGGPIEFSNAKLNLKITQQLARLATEPQDPQLGGELVKSKKNGDRSEELPNSDLDGPEDSDNDAQLEKGEPIE